MTQEAPTEMKKIDEDAKKRFDALAMLEQAQWKEFDNKVTHEWRLSFAIWTSMVVSSGAILGGKIRFGQPQPLAGLTPIFAAVGIVIVIISLHGWFLLWIQTSLQKTRNSLWRIRRAMEEIVGVQCHLEVFSRNRFKQASMYIQWFISILLGGVFIWIVSVAP